MPETEQAQKLAARLRRETWPIHQRLEDDLGLMAPDLSRERYLWLLTRFWGFHSPWEAALTAIFGEGDAIFAPRRRLHLLEQDLTFLGLTAEEIAALPLCPHLPVFRSREEALGSLYVLEGSTLGGRFITRHVRARFGWSEEQGMAYFHSHGAQVGAMWQDFRRILSAHSSPAADDAITGMAVATFIALHRWLCVPKEAEA
ncbi:biliverdin-producing heme oxygenase [Telmatospirillum sp. J64-1]|uniref:biliverdin-producing heme oxygenase n=1 Tax=Telmatospirillum sp. J64-1 TaxID=2502183 RepID=UPI00163DD428|nr:biliverdin-producing heme oxygenase [Telmatospirillum sp. J64-1]